ncbi:MAG: bacterial Ig-like domain-containing protein [Clostridia bacterium]|nr:bacterial Ig-like domain-containing protein [Clostridia bacterium]
MKIKTIVSCIVMCILILIGVQSNAAIEASVTGSCPTEAKPGDKITFNVNINVTSAGSGIDGFVAELEYPSDILTINVASSSSSDFFIMDGMLMGAFDDAIKSGTKTIALDVQIKEGVSAESATIKLSGIELTDLDKTTKDMASISKTISLKSSGESEATLTEIVITKPSKTTVKVGENLDVSSMKVTAKYSDGSTKDVTSLCKWYWDGKEVSSLNGQSLTQGTHTVKAVYEGKEDSFTITVEASSTGSGNSGSTTGGDNTTANKVIDKAGLEIITIPGIMLAIAVAVISYKKYKMF